MNRLKPSWSVTRSTLSPAQEKQFEVIVRTAGWLKGEVDMAICGAIGEVKKITALTLEEAERVLDYLNEGSATA